MVSRSSTLEYVDPPPPPSKKGRGRTQGAASVTPPNHSMEVPVDSDLKDPNVSQDEAEGEGHKTLAPTCAPEAQTVTGRPTFKSVRRSARFSSMTSLTTMSTLTPLPSTPDVEEKPGVDIDVQPKRETKREPKLESSSHVLLASYLPDAQPFAISPPPITLEVPRAFLRLAYGGCDQRFLQFIPASRNPGPSHTVTTHPDGTETRVPKAPRRMVFPMLKTNPLMPRTPGAPGLLFTSRQGILHDAPWTLFVKRSSGQEHAVWLYLGEYGCELVGRLTPEQFKPQPVVVQRSWAKLVTTRRRQECYASMRARITLRAVGLIPLDNKEQEEQLIRDEVNNIQSKKRKGKNITIDQVLKAFARGDEAVNIIRMTCVSYDHVFANDMVAQFDDYPTMIAAAEEEKQEKKQIKEEKQIQKQKPSGSGGTRNGKRSTTYVSEDENDNEDEDEDEERDEEGGDVAPEEPSDSSKKGKGKKTAQADSASKSKSDDPLSTGSSSRGTLGSSSPGSSRPQRRTSAAATTFVDGVEDKDHNHGTDDGEGGFESDDAVEAKMSESDATWRPRTTSRFSLSSMPASSQSQRARTLGQKILDSAGTAEH
ncbi:hypothetical protein D9619_002216 [Psilocybe cf. subviscida]|uniref:DUF6697 domain-containing protein n=1 Tax=Psilocybe cf. subviscida TaxID=2480587 RepID=A0A8H5F473_9AGAR|nr:hypothetical protein D9619_002216 [Psilocybe cf. subviscida]